MDTQAKRIIEKFGGVYPLARALGHRNPTTVQGWLSRGFIPPRQHEPIWEAAKRDGVAVSLADFAAVSSDAASPHEAA
jgi:hypothetical protein